MTGLDTPVIPADIVALADYERHARARLPAPIWAYLNGAGADGLTKRANRAAFDRLRLEGSVLADMRAASTATTLFGMDMAAPIMLAPVAYQRLAHAEGEAASALGAAASGLPMAVSTQASMSVEDIAAAAPADLLFQLYMQADRGVTLDLVRRAEAAGCAALLVTVDAPVNGVRNEEVRAGFALPRGIGAPMLAGVAQPTITAGPGESPVFRGLLAHAPRWDDLEWLAGQTQLPVVPKGIMSARDAAQAVRLGVAGIAVSNHGGRTLDTLPATIEALPRIADAVGGTVPLILDGGVRRGTDVLKSLALGASAVMLGEPVVHALAVGGAVGVAHMLTILKAELEVAMALTGCATVGAVTRDCIWQD